MLLTDKELQLVRASIETQSGFDDELITRCGPLFSIEAFDNAVQQAFVVLEERLRHMLEKDKLTSKQLIDYGFSPNGPFTILLKDNGTEYEGLKSLLLGAFMLYRNATAHTIVGYDCGEARAIINLVDLLLKRLDSLARLSIPDNLPAAVEPALAAIEQTYGASVANRARVFMGKCLSLGINIPPSAKQWLPFRKLARTKFEHWPEPKPHAVAIFYIYLYEKDQGLWFPVNQYHQAIVGVNVEETKTQLRELRFNQSGKLQDYSVSFGIQNSQGFFDAVLQLVAKIAQQWDSTLA